MIQLCLLFLAGLTLIFGALVFLNKPKDRISKFYGLFSLGSASWMITNALTANNSYFYEPTLGFKLVANQLVVPACTLAALTFLLFAAGFSGNLRSMKRWIQSLVIISVGISLFSFTDAYSYVEHGKLEIGRFYWLFVLHILFYMASTAYALFRKGGHKKADPLFNTQLFYLRTGYIFAVVPAFTLGGIIALTSTADITALSPASLIFFMLFAGIAIVRHKLFDIRLFVARSLAYALLITTLAGLYISSTFGLTALLLDGTEVSGSQNALNVFLALFLAATFQPLKKFFDRLTRNLFYQDSYDAQSLLDALSSSLVLHPELDDLVKSCSPVIKETVGLSQVYFVLKNTNDKRWRIVGDHPRNLQHQIIEVVEELKPVDTPLAVDVTELPLRFVQKLRTLGVGAIFEMNTKTELIGYLVAGIKRSGNLFDANDIRAFNTIADELAIAFQSATRFEEIERFNETLQGEIEDATRQLRHTNEKLRALDATKDEFISMASHQLRTPLTSVKGYVSMVLEGDAGELNEQQRKLLTQAFISSQRMVYLIADLLNVSRLRTGKFVIETTPTYLPDIVEGELGQLQETADAKNLKLVYKKPKDFPTLNLDETKIRQVIMNFADNAIYYTNPGGRIEVVLEAGPRTVEFKVIDNGLGVPRGEQHHLFNKFYRAENAKRARPDGTGLGLFMAKKVVIAQGGAIIFQSKEGKGSTFGFTFPRAKLEVDKKPAENHA